MVEATFALLFGAVAVAAVAVVVAPLRRPEPKPGVPDERQEELLARRETALQAISDLDFDYRLGNLAEGDYRELRERQKLEAIALLRATNGQNNGRIDGQINGLSTGGAVTDDPLDAEI